MPRRQRERAKKEGAVRAAPSFTQFAVRLLRRGSDVHRLAVLLDAVAAHDEVLLEARNDVRDQRHLLVGEVGAGRACRAVETGQLWITRPYCEIVIVWDETSTRATRLAVQPCTVVPNSIVAKAIATRTVFFMRLHLMTDATIFFLF